MLTDLPIPADAAQQISARLTDRVVAEIAASGGWISFARYMELALYEPGLGYYAGGSRKFGEAGDFVTAPELTPLFGQALARQVAEVMATSAPCVIEAGAGSGRLAADILLALDALGCAPEKYAILELSGELRARQAATLQAHAPQWLARVEWLDELPEKFSGCLIGNEVLDAMPTHRVRWTDRGIDELGVAVDGERLVDAAREAQGALLEAAQALTLSPPYRGEISLAVRAWITELAHRLERGAMILIDYGLSRHEIYHPQRDGGTLRCHYRHRLHDDPYWHPGLSDITSHVDFTAVAEAGFDAGLDVLGYTSQATFLINCGLAELMTARRESDPTVAARTQNAANVLISPGEMGELFKVVALGRGLSSPLLGFVRGDRTHGL